MKAMFTGSEGSGAGGRGSGKACDAHTAALVKKLNEMRSALGDRQVVPFRWTGVVAGRTDDLVVLPLLEDVGAPAGDAAGGENAGEQFARNSHVVLEARRIEIDVAVLVNRLLNHPFELDRNFVPFRLSLFEAQPARKLFEVPGARVFDLVNRVAEAH